MSKKPWQEFAPDRTRPDPWGQSRTIQSDHQRFLRLFLRSVKGELPEDQAVSEAQMGAFFAGMTIRKGFPKKTRWSEAEIAAFDKYRPDLEQLMSPEIRFIIQPALGHAGANPDETVVVKALEKILRGGHLTYDETRQMGKAILNGNVSGALKGAALIGQRMNLESYDEVRGYLDATFGPEQVREVSVESLTHFGQPFDGATRYFRPTLFIAAVRAALGEPSVLHGVDEMPPKKRNHGGAGFEGARCPHGSLP